MTGVYIAILTEVKAFNHGRLQAISWLLTDGTRDIYFYDFEFLVSILSYTDPLDIFGWHEYISIQLRALSFFHLTELRIYCYGGCESATFSPYVLARKWKERWDVRPFP